MHPYLIEMLECPACHGKLDWSITERHERSTIALEDSSHSCKRRARFSSLPIMDEHKCKEVAGWPFAVTLL